MQTNTILTNQHRDENRTLTPFSCKKKPPESHKFHADYISCARTVLESYEKFHLSQLSIAFNQYKTEKLVPFLPKLKNKKKISRLFTNLSNTTQFKLAGGRIKLASLLRGSNGFSFCIESYLGVTSVVKKMIFELFSFTLFSQYVIT